MRWATTTDEENLQARKYHTQNITGMFVLVYSWIIPLTIRCTVIYIEDCVLTYFFTREIIWEDIESGFGILGLQKELKIMKRLSIVCSGADFDSYNHAFSKTYFHKYSYDI